MNIYLLHQILEDRAARYPGNEAIVYRDQSLNYSDLESKSNQLARLLIRNGVKAGDRVGIMLGKCLESIISIFGILKTGACYVPIDPSAPATRVSYILRNCEIMILLTSEHILGRLGDLDTSGSYPGSVIVTERTVGASVFRDDRPTIIDWQEIDRESDSSLEKVSIPDVNPAYILHTSGSTGYPKGVVISHLNALAFVNMTTDFFKVSEEDRLCNHAALYFDLSMFDIFVALNSGGTVVLIPENLSVFPVMLAEYIEKKKITVWNSVSSILSMLAIRGSLNRFTFPSLRLVIFSGEILPVKYLRILKTHMTNAEFYNIYGQTEANSSTYYKANELPRDDSWKIPIGRPFPNFEVFVLDEGGKIIDFPGGEGELYVKGSTVANGYWRDPERTRERFITDPRVENSPINVYRTGDLVRRDENGDLIFAGRKDHLIKSRGYRIELDEIEVALNSHPMVRQAAVIPIPDETIGNRIVACVATFDGAKGAADDILSYCSKLLPKYMIPEKIEFYENLPQTPNGKIDRKTLINSAL